MFNILTIKNILVSSSLVLFVSDLFFKNENHTFSLFWKCGVLTENSVRVGTFVSNMVNTGLSFLGKLRSSPSIAQEQQAN